MNFLKTATGVLLVFSGIVAIVIGLAIAGTEVWHLFHGSHSFETKPFIYAALFMMGGPMLMTLVIQTGSVKESLGIIAQYLPLVRSMKAGGQRSTDPPIEEKKDDAGDKGGQQP